MRRETYLAQSRRTGLNLADAGCCSPSIAIFISQGTSRAQPLVSSSKRAPAAYRHWSPVRNGLNEASSESGARYIRPVSRISV